MGNAYLSTNFLKTKTAANSGIAYAKANVYNAGHFKFQNQWSHSRVTSASEKHLTDNGRRILWRTIIIDHAAHYVERLSIPIQLVGVNEIATAFRQRLT